MLEEKIKKNIQDTKNMSDNQIRLMGLNSLLYARLKKKLNKKGLNFDDYTLDKSFSYGDKYWGIIIDENPVLAHLMYQKLSANPEQFNLTEKLNKLMDRRMGQEEYKSISQTVSSILGDCGFEKI